MINEKVEEYSCFIHLKNQHIKYKLYLYLKEYIENKCHLLITIENSLFMSLWSIMVLMKCNTHNSILRNLKSSLERVYSLHRVSNV
jgi:hypothetical protein